jgi:methionyl-tRNA formyltransferase
MKKILVISDNEHLVRHLKVVQNLKEVAEAANFDYRFSIKNKNPGSLIALGMEPIDLKSENACKEVIERYQLVISLHCKQIFPSNLVNQVTCINFHPGYNPHNRGWYPQVFSIINKKPIGVTIHVMDEMIDHGKIITQKKLDISSEETSFDVYNRVIELEKKMISENIISIINGTYELFETFEEGNYNSINDFKMLCHLDLDHVGTLREHIDKLRALSHGDFSNAFYVEGGKSIYVKLVLSEK